MQVEYRLADGLIRTGHGVALSDDSAAFWFFTPENLEVLVKVLDGRPVNGHFWVFFGALSDLDYTVRVTDSTTGLIREYFSVPGQPTSLADTTAFGSTASALSSSLPASLEAASSLLGIGSSPLARRGASWSSATGDVQSSLVATRSGLQTITQAHLEEADPNAQAAESARHQHCLQGQADTYPCSNVDLLALMTMSEMGQESGVSGNDLWGWTDPKTSREYALMGMSNGTAFVDVTDGGSPQFLGHLGSRGRDSPWRDIKTYGNYALIVADSSPSHGMQIFDLRRLRGITEPQTFSADASYNGFGSAHNIVVNETAGMAYAVGSDACGGGLHMMSVRNPLEPEFAGCFDADGYTHDAQCVYYTGPDNEFFERQLCFASNEDSLTIVDVTNPSSPVQVSRTDYAGRSYAHQSWLSPNQRTLFLDDETDERNNGHNTRTYIWDVSSLRNPRVIGTHTAATSAIDHNQYASRGFLFQSNYRAGLRILDLAKSRQGRLAEVAYFDVEPADDAARFNGAWSNYPFFNSGTVLVSDTGRGLFVLQPILPGFALPEAVTDLSVEFNNFKITLHWTNVCHHASTIRVYRRVEQGPRLLLAELPSGSSSYVDTDLFPSSDVTYDVVSVTGSRESEPATLKFATPSVPTSCTTSATTLCLAGGRFQVQASWQTTAENGVTEGTGGSISLTGDTGSFWFFDRANYEIVVKVLDGRSVNGAFWVFIGGLSDVAYQVAVIDTEAGIVKTYENQLGDLVSRADTSAFPE